MRPSAASDKSVGCSAPVPTAVSLRLIALGMSRARKHASTAESVWASPAERPIANPWGPVALMRYPGWVALQRTLNGFDVETFDDVTLLHVLVIGEGHAAFLAGLHLAHFILEALEGGEFAFMDHDIVADQPYLGTAAHDAFGDLAACNLADLGDVEHFQDLGIAQELLARLGRQHARQRRLHIIHQIVDDVVIADFHAIALGAVARLVVGAYIEAEHRRAAGMSQDHVAFGDAADARLQNLGADFVGPQLGQRALNGFAGAL